MINDQIRYSEIPASYPFDQYGPVPLDANAALEWLDTATKSELAWYYELLLG